MEQDLPLPFGIRLRVRFHRFFCVWCARYAKQLQFIKKSGEEFSDHAEQLAGPSLDDDAKARLKIALRR
jgi:hypothetical protein